MPNNYPYTMYSLISVSNVNHSHPRCRLTNTLCRLGCFNVNYRLYYSRVGLWEGYREGQEVPDGRNNLLLLLSFLIPKGNFCKQRHGATKCGPTKCAKQFCLFGWGARWPGIRYLQSRPEGIHWSQNEDCLGCCQSLKAWTYFGSC